MAQRKVEAMCRIAPGESMRVTTKERREYLLAWGTGISFFYGKGYNFLWKNLGSGVWEVSLVEAK